MEYHFDPAFWRITERDGIRIATARDDKHDWHYADAESERIGEARMDASLQAGWLEGKAAARRYLAALATATGADRHALLNRAAVETRLTLGVRRHMAARARAAWKGAAR